MRRARRFGRAEWRAATKGDTKPDGKAQEKEKRLEMSGKPLCEVLSPRVAVFYMIYTFYTAKNTPLKSLLLCVFASLR